MKESFEQKVERYSIGLLIIILTSYSIIIPKINDGLVNIKFNPLLTKNTYIPNDEMQITKLEINSDNSLVHKLLEKPIPSIANFLIPDENLQSIIINPTKEKNYTQDSNNSISVVNEDSNNSEGALESEIKKVTKEPPKPLRQIPSVRNLRRIN